MGLVEKSLEEGRHLPAPVDQAPTLASRGEQLSCAAVLARHTNHGIKRKPDYLPNSAKQAKKIKKLVDWTGLDLTPSMKIWLSTYYV